MKSSDFLNKLKEESKLALVEPSEEISSSYSAKSENCLRSAKILFEEKIYENSVTEAYYAMYNSALSLFFKCGIKCENHTAAIILLERLFQLKRLGQALLKAKKDRIDSQYYVISAENQPLTKEAASGMISDAENFKLGLRVYIGQLNAEEKKQSENSLLILCPIDQHIKLSSKKPKPLYTCNI